MNTAPYIFYFTTWRLYSKTFVKLPSHVIYDIIFPNLPDTELSLRYTT